MKKIYRSFDELRRLAEDLVKERGENDALSRMDMIELVEEVRIHQAELEIQNEELRRGQEEISLLHREYENLYEFAPCGYVVVGSKGDIIRCNLTGTTLLGAHRGRLLNRTFGNFLAWESRNDFFNALKEAENNGSVKALELKLSLDDDSFLWVRADIQAHPAPDNRTMEWRLTLVDISEQKKAKVELALREEKYHALLDQSLDMIFLHDLKGDFLEVNPEAIRHTGYSRDELLAMNVFDLHPDRTERKSEIMDMWAGWRPGESTTIELTHLDKHGRKYPVEINTGKVRFGHKDYILAAVRDITVRKQNYEALQESLEEKEVLLREVHHRVKNNLAIITTLLQMELEEVKDSAAAAVLWDLENRIRSIALVHELLYQKGNLARIDFQDYLDTLLHDLRYSLGEGKNIRYIALAGEIRLGIDVAIPCGMIINELVTNAIKYAFPDGKAHGGQNGPEISVKVRKDNDHYHIVVADNGVGIPEEIDLYNTQSFGLRLVRMIGKHQLGGKLELDRASGTRVIFTFKPRHKENSLPEIAHPALPPLAGPAN